MARRTKKANGKVSSHRTWFTLPVDISFSRKLARRQGIDLETP